MKPEALAHAEAELERLLQSNAYFRYSMAGENGPYTITNGSVCYSSCGGQYPEGQNSIFVDASIFPFYEKFDRDENVFKRYIKWLVKRSFLSKAFISKDVEKIWKRGALFNAEKYSAYYIIAAATALRYVSENPKIVVVWDILKEHTTLDQAFILAHHFSPHYENKKLVGLVAGCSSKNSNHIIPPPLQINLKGQRVNRRMTGPMAGDASYRGLTKMWDGKNGLRHFALIDCFPNNKIRVGTNSFGKPIYLKYYPLNDLKRVVEETLKLNSTQRKVHRFDV